MKLIYSLIISLFIISCNNKSDNPPNFILILADDQGWSGTSVKMSSNNDYSKVNILKHRIWKDYQLMA